MVNDRQDRPIAIYLVTNQVNGKIYIGQTCKTVAERWREHLKDHSKLEFPFYRGIRKHGMESFSVRQIDVAENKTEADFLERAYIAIFQSHIPTNGYNARLGGEGGSPNQQTRDKIGRAHKGKVYSEETRRKIGDSMRGEKNWLFGKHIPDETKRKMSEAQRGEKNHYFGKKASEETRRKLREKRSSHVWPDETKAKIKASNLKTFSNPEVRARRKEQMKRLWADPAYRAKQAAARIKAI